MSGSRTPTKHKRTIGSISIERHGFCEQVDYEPDFQGEHQSPHHLVILPDRTNVLIKHAALVAYRVSTAVTAAR